MILNAKNNKISLGDSDMHYVSFGTGDENLVIILGLGDGLKSVKGQAFTLGNYYKEFGKRYKTYIFGRKDTLTSGYSTRDMAKDQKKAMDMIGLKQAHVLGISQGGMIAQHLAIDYPEAVKSLIIGISISRPNETLEAVVNRWVSFAKQQDYKSLIEDTLKMTYTESKYNKYKKFLPVITRIGKPKSFDRFLIQAQACLQHDAYEKLHFIKSPTLVIGGDDDKVTGPNTSQEIANRIQDSQLVIYQGYGHGVYDEVADFNQQVMLFIEKNKNV
jgi:pimeloyl-ACP methyl ester carboxylesterase